jgi:hypothetical protein
MATEVTQISTGNLLERPVGPATRFMIQPAVLSRLGALGGPEAFDELFGREDPDLLDLERPSL